ncbi:DUF6985 domain-containing protein [Vibrio rotiferianus]|uniref:DUF6985 domain-containing protein n=1 Tax=Vibrio rotiferianus TaxID=190895 RepID=UPI00406A9494
MKEIETSFGLVKLEEKNKKWATEPIKIKLLGNLECRFLFDDAYIFDINRTDYHSAISNFYNLNPNILFSSSQYAFQYYKEITEQLDPNSDWYNENHVDISTEQDVWSYVQFSDVLYISRNEEDATVYIVLGGNCDWEPEHGIQLVFKEGRFINRLSSIDFILTNEELGVVYESYT